MVKMVLFAIEYETKAGHIFKAKIVGSDHEDIMREITQRMGEVKVYNLCHMGDVHLISNSITKGLVEEELKAYKIVDKGIDKGEDLIYKRLIKRKK